MAAGAWIMRTYTLQAKRGIGMKNVTMRDIGAALGVSTVTISKALGGKEGVSGLGDKIKDALGGILGGKKDE